MKKKFLLYAAAVVLSISAFTGCVSAPEGNGGQGAAQQGRKEGAGPVDVVMRWLEAVKTEDAEAYIETYWPEAEKVVQFGSERIELFGREEILEHQQQAWEQFDMSSLTYERPQLRDHELPDRAVVLLVHSSHRFTDTFLLWKRKGVWKIEHHSLDEIPNPKVTSDFQRWADKDGSGELEDEEYKHFVRAGTTLVIGPHRSKSPIDDVFDFNEDGVVDEKEVRVARTYFFTLGLTRLIKSIDDGEFKKRLDLDGSGSFDGKDLEVLQRYLFTFNYLKLREREVKTGFDRWMDGNGDGLVTKDEQIDGFHRIFEPILLLPHDPERIKSAAMKHFEDDGGVSVSDEGTVAEQKAAPSDIAGKQVAVMGLESMTGTVSSETVDGLLLFIENAFVNSSRVKVVDRKNIESIVEEYEFQRTAMTDESTAVEIGKLANAELIVIGAVTFVGERYYLNIKLIDVQSGQIVGSSLAEADAEGGFLEMCNSAVEALFSD